MGSIGFSWFEVTWFEVTPVKITAFINLKLSELIYALAEWLGSNDAPPLHLRCPHSILIHTPSVVQKFQNNKKVYGSNTIVQQFAKLQAHSSSDAEGYGLLLAISCMHVAGGVPHNFELKAR